MDRQKVPHKICKSGKTANPPKYQTKGTLQKLQVFLFYFILFLILKKLVYRA
jgi:hypothetical protein